MELEFTIVYLPQDKRIISIQILFSGDNVILVKAFGCSYSHCRNLILAIVLECKQKDFLYLDYFLMTEYIHVKFILNSEAESST
jgi:hypothetical protein